MFRMSADADTPLRKILLLTVALVIILAVFAATIYLALKKQVEVVIDGQVVPLSTLSFTVEDFLAANNVVLGPNDAIDAELDSILKHGQVINISRAFDIGITADGQSHTLNTIPITVAEALDLAGVTTNPEDKISLPLDQIITEPASIQVVRVTTEYYHEKIVISAQVQNKDDNTLEKGISKVLSQGKDGLRENVYLITREDGVVTKREMTETNVLKASQPKVVAHGTITLASRGGHTLNFSEAKIVSSTAYTGGGRTATGTAPKVGTVAVDPRVIPYGTKIYIEGYGIGIAEDTGSSIRGDKIDVYFDTRSECRKWGVRKVKIYILN